MRNAFKNCYAIFVRNPSYYVFQSRSYLSKFQMKYLVGILLFLIFEKGQAVKECPVLPVNFEAYGVKGCGEPPPQRQVGVWRDVPQNSECLGYKGFVYPAGAGCNHPVLPDNAILLYPCTCNHNKICLVECKEGYKMEGDFKIKCLTTGKWSHTPECKPKICNATYGDRNLVLRGKCNNRYESVCELACNDPVAYRYVGPRYIKCIDGEWKGIENGTLKPLPSCIHQCKLSEIPDYLVAEGECDPLDGKLCSFQCKRSSLYMLGDKLVRCNRNKWGIFPLCGCNPVIIPENMMLFGPFCTTDRCLAVCKPTYTTADNTTILVCGADGKWDLAQSTKCRKICPPIQEISSELVFADVCYGIEGNQCTAKCSDQTKELLGDPTFTCLSTGLYSQLPTCGQIDMCPDSSFNQQIEFVGECSRRKGVNCTIKCKDKDEEILGGDPFLFCTEIEAYGLKYLQWHVWTTCGKKCPIPSFSPDTVVLECDNRPDGKCKFKCPLASDKEKIYELTCSAGAFGPISRDFMCPGILCPIPDGKNYAITCQDQTKCSYKCLETRFRRREYPSRTVDCNTETRKWSKMGCLANCVFPDTRSDIRTVSFCTYLEGHKCYYECKDHTKSLQKNYTTCELDSRGYPVFDESPMGTCVPVDLCEAPPNYPFIGAMVSCVSMFQSKICTFACKDPADIYKRKVSAMCNLGVWTIQDKGECQNPSVRCETLLLGANQEVDPEMACSQEEDGWCMIRCKHPNQYFEHTLEKPPAQTKHNIHCVKRKWVGLYACVTACPEIEVGRHIVKGTRIMDKGNCKRTINSRCQITCLLPPNRRTGTFYPDELQIRYLHCYGDANWYPTYYQAATLDYCISRCEQPPYKVPPFIQYAVSKCSGVKFEICPVTCVDRPIQSGVPHITCMEGLVWSAFPVCGSPYCPPLPPDMYFDRTNPLTCPRTVGSTCKVYCMNPDYVVAFDSTIPCDLNSQWRWTPSCVPPRLYLRASSDAGYCDLPDPEKVQFINPPCRIGQWCRVRCSSENEHVKDTNLLFCSQDGKLDPVECTVRKKKFCFRRDMGETDLILREPSPYRMFQRYPVSCPKDMVLKGVPYVLCEPDGKFGYLPKCYKMCDKAMLDPYGLVPVNCSFAGDTYCQVACTSGYLKNIVTVYCNETGDWHYLAPAVDNCIASEPTMRCPPLPPQFQSLDPPGSRLQRLKCNDSWYHRLQGPHVVLCNTNGSWSEFPVCVNAPPTVPSCKGLGFKRDVITFKAINCRHPGPSELYHFGERCIFQDTRFCRHPQDYIHIHCMSNGEFSKVECHDRKVYLP